MSKIVKTEHNGPKRGKGAWEPKKVAKKFSNRRRRQDDKKACEPVGPGHDDCGREFCEGCDFTDGCFEDTQELNQEIIRQALKSHRK